MWSRTLLKQLSWLLLLVLRPYLVHAQDDDDEGDAPIAKPEKGGKASSGADSDSANLDLDEDAGGSSGGEPWLDAEDYGYAMFFLFLSVVCAVLIHRFWKVGVSAYSPAITKKEKKSPEFYSFQRNFLIGFALNVAADWMQGPYVYKLYSFYGFSKGEIGSLFVAGFFSSMVFGTIVAGLADRFGRRQMCMIYSFVYGAACLTKHSTNFWVLCLGRLLAGIATSILHSSFESWYVAQHRQEHYPEELLIETLAWMSFVKGFVAIFAAVLSSVVAHRFGFVAPFDTAALLLMLGALVVQRRWKENYGDKTATPASSFSRSLVVLAVNPKVWLLGFVQSCFEGAMYIFVFSWTPILEATTAGEDLPHGIVFGCFMVSIMIGSNMSHYLLLSQSAETVASTACGIAAFSLMLSAFYESHQIVFTGFCLFESCVGIYFPAIASQRAKHVPNEVRATIMGIFRVPLNLIVVLTLLNASQLGTGRLVTFSSLLLGSAFLGERALGFLSTHASEPSNNEGIGGDRKDNNEVNSAPINNENA